MEKTIFLIRHGQTDYNKKGIVQGSGIDSSINPTGTLQATAFYQRYHHLPFDVVITSALQRTHQTVMPFIETGLRWEQFADINEMNWGIHEGKHRNPEMKGLYTEMMHQWSIGNFNAKLEKGESAAELAQRVQRFIDHLKNRSESNLLICSHGRAIRCLVCLMKELPLFEMEQFGHSNTGLYKIFLRDDKFEFELENDVLHLKDLV